MLKRSDLFTLLDAAPTLGVSIFMPTHLRGAETRQDPIRMKTLLAEARGKLGEAGLSPGEADEMLAPATDLIGDHDFWQHQEQGLALFLGGGAPRHYHLPMAMPERVVVGPGFHIRPLLAALAPDDGFLLLTITADHVRLYEADRHGLRENTEAGLPGSLAEITGEDEDYENPQQASPANRPQVAPSGITNAQVQGDSPEEWRKGRLVEFIRRIAAALDTHVAADERPVVIAANAQAQGHFRLLTKLGPQLAGIVEGNPEALERDALHAAALGVLQPHFEARRRRVTDLLRARLGSHDSRVALEIPAILDASQTGRIDTLLLASDSAPPAAGRQNDDPLDASAAGTLRHGGAVEVLPNEEMPAGAAAAAILRY